MAYIDVVYKDCSTEEGMRELQKAVHRCKPFQKLAPDEKVPFGKLERLVAEYCRKYNASVQWMRADFSTGTAGSEKFIHEKVGTYHAEVSRQRPYMPICEIAAGSMYELYAKLCVAIRWAIGSGRTV